jgi:RimJ/RimL family protein N-acetyltransferase
VELRTARLHLREVRADDWPAILAYQTDPRYLRFYEWESRDEAAVRAFVDRQVANQHEQPRRQFQVAIELVDGPDAGRLIGNCGVRVDDPTNRQGNIGYELHPDRWGHGYGSEAARAVLDHGFDALGLHRIWAQCIADNIASAHILEKLGMRREAHYRERSFFKGRWWDTFIYAILEDEWRATRPR